VPGLRILAKNYVKQVLSRFTIFMEVSFIGPMKVSHYSRILFPPSKSIPTAVPGEFGSLQGTKFID
jgi:hypothetical protein